MKLACVAAFVLLSLTARGADLRSPGLNDLPARSFDDALHKALEQGEAKNKQLRLEMADALLGSSNKCAIPLKELKSRNPELGSADKNKPALPRNPQHSMDRIAQPAPVPACKNWN
jgi:hypothetical protein